jgi:uncharacterized protein (TIGR03032 family)
MDEPTENLAENKTRKEPLRCRFHGRFADWLRGSGGTLAITTYTSGKLVLLGCEGREIKLQTHKLARPMGMSFNGERLAIAVREQILTLHLTDKGKFVPATTYNTGKVNAHDLAFGRRGLYFVNTRFNGLARVSDKKRFVHCWLPPFISTMVAQDRCHLNGLGMRAGQPALATAFCETDERNDWRKEDRFTSGVLIDIPKREIIGRGLCMPHSPRRYRGKWWLCNSGHGSLSQFVSATGECGEFASLPGFTRGLNFVGNHALVGLSKIRPKHILDAPPVRERHPELVAGVALVSLNTGKQTGLLEFTTGGREVFEVTFLRNLPNARLAGPGAPGS